MLGVPLYLTPEGADDIIALEITEVSPDLVVLQLKEEVLGGIGEAKHHGVEQSHGFEFDILQREGCGSHGDGPSPTLPQAVTREQSREQHSTMNGTAEELRTACSLPESRCGNLELQFYPCDVCEASFTDAQELAVHTNDFHFKNIPHRREWRKSSLVSFGLDSLPQGPELPHWRGGQGKVPASCRSVTCSKFGTSNSHEERQKGPQPVDPSSPPTAETQCHPLKCVICGRIFRQPKALQRHQRSHSQRQGPCNRADVSESQEPETAEALNPCPECGRTFKMPKMLNRHQRIYHLKGPAVLRNSPRRPTLVKNLSTLRCCECDRHFGTSETFYKHQCFHLRKQLRAFKAAGRRSEGTKFFLCQLCALRFKGGMEFEHHVRDLHPEEYAKTARTKCGDGEGHGKISRCEDGLLQKVGPKERGSITEEQQPEEVWSMHLCPDGRKSFSIQKVLMRHQKTRHCKAETMSLSGPKNSVNHKCSKCTKTFKTLKELQQHGRMHRTENTFKCSDCGRHFDTGDTFYKHQCFHLRKQLRAFKALGRRSEGAKFFHCQLCALRFKGGMEFEHHVRDLHPEEYAKTTRTKCGDGEAHGKGVRLRPRDGEEHIKINSLKSAAGDKCVLPGDTSNSGQSRTAAITENQEPETAEALNPCPECGRTFKMPKMLNRHQRIYHLKGPAVLRNSPRRPTLVKNLSTLRCCECDRHFGTSETFYKHQCFHLRKQLRAFKAAGRRSEGEKFFHCQLCALRFKGGMEFEHHVRDLHPEEYAKTARTKCGDGEGHRQDAEMVVGADCCQATEDGCGSGSVLDGAGEDLDRLYGSKESTGRWYLCGDCGKYFKERNNLRRHQEVHARIAKLYECTECGKNFSRSEHLTRHRYVHAGDPSFTCDVCGQRFRDPGRLRSHQKLHPELQKFGCRRCSQKFGQAAELSAHEQGVHARQTEFPCGQCDKCFRNLRGLRKHQQTHSKQRPFLCSQCGKGFGRCEHLHRHEYVHLSEKPHTCADCGKSFKHKEDIRRHSRKIHCAERKVYRCPQCQVCLYSASALRRHLLLHTGRHPHTCHICGKGFVDHYRLRRHYRVHTEWGPRTRHTGQAQGAPNPHRGTRIGPSAPQQVNQMAAVNTVSTLGTTAHHRNT